MRPDVFPQWGPRMDEKDDKATADGESHLRDSVEGLRQVAFGIVGRLAGAEHVGEDVDLEKPAVSPEVDAAIERLGVALGSVLEEAGRALKKQSSEKNPAEGLNQDSGPGPLFAQGADALANGLQVLAREVQAKLSGDESPEDPNKA